LFFHEIPLYSQGNFMGDAWLAWKYGEIETPVTKEASGQSPRHFPQYLSLMVPNAFGDKELMMISLS
jgi:hypothetical protein